MKLKSFFVGHSAILVCVVAGLSNASSWAQNASQYALTWSALDSGSGRSQGGTYVLDASVGQMAAGTLSGGSYRLESGFWNGVTVQQTPGAPLLKIRKVSPEKVVLSWPIDVPGFQLEETLALKATTWNATAEPIIDTATEHTVTVSSVTGLKCFRLKAKAKDETP